MLDYDDIVEQYKTLALGGENGLEAAEAYIARTFDDTAIPEEVSKDIEVFLMRQLEASADTVETPVSDVQAENTQEDPQPTEANVEG